MRVFYCLFLFLCFSCSKDDPDIPDGCVPVIFDESKFNSTSNFGLNLIEYSLEESCLQVTLGVSGCDDAHVIELVSNAAVSPSSPALVIFDFYDNDPQLCEAYFTIEREFDVSPIREKFGFDIIMRFRNNEGSVTIEN